MKTQRYLMITMPQKKREETGNEKPVLLVDLFCFRKKKVKVEMGMGMGMRKEISS